MSIVNSLRDLSRAAVAAADSVSSVRDEIVRLVVTATESVPVAEMDKFVRSLSKDVLAAIRAEYSADVLEGSTAENEETLEYRGAMSEDEKLSREVASRVAVMKVRISEGKRIALALKAGNSAATLFAIGAVSATYVLDTLKKDKSEKGTAVTSEGDSEVDSEAGDTFDLTAAIATAIQAASKRGMQTADIVSALMAAAAKVQNI
jgi:hypothetical protein